MILIDGKKVAEADLLKKFKLNFNKSAEFERIGIKPDTLNGGLKTGREIRIQPAYMIRVDDIDVELRITGRINRRKNKKGDIEESYSTDRFVFKSEKYLTTRIDEFIFLALNPKNIDSPFFNSKSQNQFRLRDPEADARAIVQKMEYEDQARSIIKSLSGADLRIKAAGIYRNEHLRKAGARIVGKNMSDIEIKAMLLQVATKQPKLLCETLEAAINIVIGVLNEAVELQIVKLITRDTKRLWVYNDERITAVNFDDPEPILSLRDAVSNTMAEENGFYNKIRTALYNKYFELKVNTNKVDAEQKKPLFQEEAFSPDEISEDIDDNQSADNQQEDGLKAELGKNRKNNGGKNAQPKK